MPQGAFGKNGREAGDKWAGAGAKNLNLGGGTRKKVGKKMGGGGGVGRKKMGGGRGVAPRG